MHTLAIAVLALPVVALGQPAAAPAKADSKAPATTTPVAAAPTLAITLNTDEAPELKEWAEKSKVICQEWFPKLCEALPSEGFEPAKEILIVFRKTLSAPAMAGGGVISVSVPHVTNNPGDFGMMVHELTHIVQAYPGQKENLGWLTEGIADYTRFWLYEPQTPQHPINKERASYRDAYRTTAAFLGYLTAKHDKDIVKKLNAKLRKGEGEAALFKEFLGKTVDELWKEFIDFGAPSSPAALAEAMKAKTDADAKSNAKPAGASAPK
jgi:hypothetical protein